MWYRFFKIFFAPLVRFGFRGTVIGADKVPPTGGAILVSNHIAAMDSVVIPALLPRRVTFPAKAELFQGNRGVGSKVVAWFLKAIGMVPMDRSGGRASARSLNAITRIMQQGHVVAIYPEGTRSPDGRLYKGKTGVARMALTGGVPVLPVGVIGTHKVQGPFGVPWVWRPIVVVGDPLDFSRYAERAAETSVQRWVTDEVMYAIEQLTGQEYVDVYASRVKHGDLKTASTEQYVLPRPGGGALDEK